MSLGTLLRAGGRALQCVALAAALSACGFTPMYASRADGGAVIGPVNVEQIDGKAGHVLKTELERILAVEGGPGTPLQLQITLQESISGVGYRVDESTSRADLRLIANYVLTFPDGDVARGSVWTVAAYSTTQSAFGEIAAQDDARERAAETLAQRLRAELAIRVSQSRRPN